MLKAFRNRRQSNEGHIDELLSAYLDGELHSDERAGLEARLRREPALRARLEGLRLTVNALTNLPQVEPPRNFILTPSIVTPRRPAAPRRRRRRRTWPVFGWATVTVAMLLILVFAGDAFLVGPAARTEPTDIVARAERAQEETLVERAEPATSEETETMPTAAPVVEQEGIEVEVTAEEDMDVETVVETVVEKEIVVEKETIQEFAPAAEAPSEVAVPQPTPAQPMPTATAGTEPKMEATDEMLQAFEMGVTPTGEGRMTLGQEATSAGGLITATVEAEAVVIGTPEPPVTESLEEMPLVVSPPAEMEKTEGETGPQPLQEQQATATPEAIAAALPEATPGAAEEQPSADDVLPWLRLLEIGLGLAVVALATTTLILRWRGV